jgi:selenium metabolism protein YedF
MTDHIDCRGMACPMPVVTAEKRYKEAIEGETYTVVVNDETSAENITRAVKQWGGEFVQERKGQDYLISITKGKELDMPKAMIARVILISSDTVGRGDDELGRVLMRALMASLVQSQVYPSHMIFLNAGVKLTTEGSPLLEQIRQLEAEGVQVLSCGTCLDFYLIKDKLQVGKVTNFMEVTTLLLTSEHFVSLG